ncbi:hypothetical protein BTM449_08700 [Helicobacter pylori]
MRIILPQTSLKHKSHNELNTKQYIKNKHANTRMHENFSQVKKTKEILADSQVENNPKSFVFKLLKRVC